MLLAYLHAQACEFDQARELSARSRALATELGRKYTGGGIGGSIALLAGDPSAAESHLRASYEALVEIGERGIRSSIAAELAEAVYRRDNIDEAERLTRISEGLAAPDDVDAQTRWRGVRAKVLARRGDVDEAELLARDAVSRAASTEALNLQGDAFMNLAEVLRLGGNLDEAASTAEAALRVYEQKGNVASARRAKALLAELGVPSATA